MKLRSFWLRIAVAAVLTLVAGPSVCAQDGLNGALEHSKFASAANLATPFDQKLAAADFDGDGKPDGAILVGGNLLQPQSRFGTIEVHFTGRPNADLTFESSEAALAISARDVNRDGATDIIVEQAFTHKRVQVWLNDGRGVFHKVRSENYPAGPEINGPERLESPGHSGDCPAMALPQHGSDAAMLLARSLLYGAPATVALAESLAGSSALRATLSSCSPRAPPLSYFR